MPESDTPSSDSRENVEDNIPVDSKPVEEISDTSLPLLSSGSDIKDPVSDSKSDISTEIKINKKKIRSEKQKESFKKCLEARKKVSEERKLFLKEQKEEQKRIRDEAFLNFRQKRKLGKDMQAEGKKNKKRSLAILEEAAKSEISDKSGVTLAELENNSESEDESSDDDSTQVQEEQKPEKTYKKSVNKANKDPDNMDIQDETQILSHVEKLLKSVQERKSKQIEKNSIRGKKPRQYYEEIPGFTFL